MSKTLLLGSSGFLGQAIHKKLLETGHTVLASSLSNNIKNNSTKSNLLNPKDITNLLTDEFDYVINCAGYINHSLFFDKGKHVIDEHLNGSINLIYQLQNVNLKRYIHMGSSDEYGNQESPLAETCQKIPISSYSLSKSFISDLLLMIHKESGFPFSIVRPFIIFGPNQKTDRLIPFVISKCLNNEEFLINNPYLSRDFLFIDDFVDGFIRVLNSKNLNGESVNICSGSPVLIKDLVNLIVKIIGKGKPIFSESSNQGSHSIIYGSNTKLIEMCEWSQKFLLQESLEITIESYIGTS